MSTVYICVVFLMRRRPPRSTRTDTTLSLPDALPIFGLRQRLLALIERDGDRDAAQPALRRVGDRNLAADLIGAGGILVAFDAGRRRRAGRNRLRPLGGHRRDRKSTRLNSSH